MWIRHRICSQHCMLAILENVKKSMDDGNEFRTLLTDLSETFDCIDHKRLIAKLFWYGVSSTAHANTLIRSSIEYGVPQGSVIGLLLFNIALIDLIYECDN